MSKRATAYHEAGHAVASFFYPLAGKTERLIISGDALADHNSKKHPVNEAAGFHQSGRVLPAIVGRSVDHAQVHHASVVLLSGYAAAWLYAGERCSTPKGDPWTDAEKLKHADGSDDFSRCWRLLCDADPFDSRDAIRLIPSHALASTATPEGLLRRYIRPALDSHDAKLLERFEALWREASAFVAEKWPHVQSVGDALARKRELSGVEVTELVERVEVRLRTDPPNVLKVFEQLRPA